MLGGLAWARWGRPFPYRREFVAGAMSLMWTSGGIMALLVAALPHPPDMVLAVVVAVGITAMIVGGVSWLVREHLSMKIIAAVTFIGTAAITLMVAVGGGGTTSVSFSFVYTWIVVYSLMFFRRILAAAQIGVAVLAYGIVYWLLGSFTAAEPVLLGGVTLITGAVVVGLSSARERADVDPLTQVGNRRALDRHLSLAMERVAANGGHLVVAMIDVDHFKQINDTHGHDAGDRMLERLTRSWLPLLDSHYVLTRFGGDEFTVIFPGTAPDEARVIVEELRRAAGAEATCSAGVAAWRPGDSMSMLLGRADAALYEAKRLGRDRQVAAEDDGDGARILKQAIDARQFVLHYQPIVRLCTGQVASVEALVRWQHPERGLVAPGDFIPLAEASGLIVELGEWVIQQACQDAAGWAQHVPLTSVHVGVNVSGRQLDDPSLIDVVTQALAQNGLPARCLTLELTETMLAADRPRSLQRLRALQKTGIDLAMDDFGTGYSSLDQLRRLPVGTLKIDRSFITDLPHEPEAAALVAAMIGMARGLRLAVVAEGVETVEQLDHLRAIGCDQAQGFLLGRAVPAEAVADLLRQSLRQPLTPMPNQRLGLDRTSYEADAAGMRG